MKINMKNIVKASAAALEEPPIVTAADDTIKAALKERMAQAADNIIPCRASGGVQLTPSEPWVAGQAVSYIYAPTDVTTISAGFRKNETITCSVLVDENTAKDLQDSFDYVTATEKQEPYADEDHESKKATLRFPAGKVKFVYGTVRGEEGVMVQGAEPTSYGAEVVNGKVYASWSPEFALDADYSKAKCKKNHWTFPDGVRGSESNPARMVAVNFVTGALTNKPAFRNMPKVKAKHQYAPAEEAAEIPAADAIVEAGAPAGNKNAAGDHKRNAWQASSHARNCEEQGLCSHAQISEAHMAASSLHSNAAESIKDKKSLDHRVHSGRADFHAALAEHHKSESTKATDTTPPADLVLADAVAAQLDIIYARQFGEHQILDQIADRVPATKTRAAMEEIYARVGANGQTR